MPELPEVESFRILAENARKRTIERVYAPDAWFVKNGYRPVDLQNALTGKYIDQVRRHGKLLLFDMSDEAPTVGIHFGMTGRLQVDNVLGAEQLLYGSNRVNPDWHRFGFYFDDGGALLVHDPRRLGGVELNPDESALGPDAGEISFEQLREVLRDSSVAVKTRIMDQRKIAGIGNLIADEVLWRAGIDPARVARALPTSLVKQLRDVIRETIPELTARGGSHMGDLIPHRAEGGRCPRDGAVLAKSQVGGRATWMCPKHQH